MTHAHFALRGQTLTFRGDPFMIKTEAAADFHEDGAVVIEAGRIREVGPAGAVLARHPGIAVESWPGHLIMAGFVDCHIHYPQTAVIASYGAQLIEWLNTYTFPAELKFADDAHAAASAEFFLDECLRNGTTTVSAYCTVHPGSADALFAAATRRDMRIAAGKVMMDRNAPPGLLDTAERGYRESKALIERWHGKGRNLYAVTPRFAPTSTSAQLDAAGALWREHPGTLMQTHISENPKEIAWVRELFPDATDYLGVYERHGLIGRGAIFGHAIHLTERERAVFCASGSAIAHCPTSNAFIGSGLFDLAGLRHADPAATVGLATDVGGGSSFSMMQTMRSAYEIAQLRGYSLHPVRAYYLATVGSAEAMGLGGVVGNLAPGHEADVVVLDLASRPLITERMRHARNLADVLFTQMILADDRAVRATYVAGRKLFDRDAPARAFDRAAAR